MQCTVLVDFGSTFTKAVVIEKERAEVLFSTKHPSTVSSDASRALAECLNDIKDTLGEIVLNEAEIHASSSAAGGLRMAVIGLTERLSVSAGKNVAFGSGAKIVSVMAGRITEEDVEKLSSLPLEMILFCGGYENGNSSVLMHNAKMLAVGTFVCPVIFGGNSAISKEIRKILTVAGKECYVIPNIIPQVGKLETEQGEAIIRDLFMKRITNMKGLSKVKNIVGENIIPTPKAVLDAGRLLSEGYGTQKGYGNLMIVDIGGATTDIHSYAEHMAGKGARLIGAKEPYAKRTVEGDLGMRESSDALLKTKEIDEWIAKLNIKKESFSKSILKRVRDTGYLADTDMEKNIDETIATYAAKTAARRHAGYLESTIGKSNNKIQIGKNLTEVQIVIGTGGPIIYSKNPEAILKTVLNNNEETFLLPEKASFYIDSEYILYAAGIIAQYDKKLAFHVMQNSLSLN